MIIFEAVLHITTFDTGIKGVRRVGRHFLTEQVERQGIMQVQLFLNRRQINYPKITNGVDVIWIGNTGSVHRIGSRLNGTPNASLTDKHVMRFLGQHETACAA